MITKKLKGNGRIRVARAEMDVPDRGKITTFVYPLIGPSDSQNVMNEISKQGLSRPTAAQMFSLINLVLENLGDEYCKDILSKLRCPYLWTSTKNSYASNKIIVYDNIDGNMPSDRKTLLKRHKDGDKAVRVVGYGFKREKQSVSDFMKNPYIKAQVGELPLEIVNQVATKISEREPYVWALNSESEDIEINTALSFNWGDGGLGVIGLRDGRNGYTSGVVRRKEK